MVMLIFFYLPLMIVSGWAALMQKDTKLRWIWLGILGVLLLFAYRSVT